MIPANANKKEDLPAKWKTLFRIPTLDWVASLLPLFSP
jgi:hypothetical protein